MWPEKTNFPDGLSDATSLLAGMLELGIGSMSSRLEFKRTVNQLLAFPDTKKYLRVEYEKAATAVYRR